METPHTRQDRHPSIGAVPRRHDVRALGQPRPRRQRRASSTTRSTTASTSSTPPTCTRRASRRRSSARRCKGRRDDVVLATKVHGQMGEGVNRQGNSRRWIRYEVEQSLRRLGTDYIDLYQIHRPDPTVEVEETLSVLTDLLHEGKVRAIGSSTFPAEEIVEAQWVAERRGYERFRCEQPPYSILARGIERAVLPTCARYGMGVIVWSPLNGGWLTGKYKRGQEYPKGTRASWGLMDPPEAQAQPAQVRRDRATREGRGRRRHLADAPRDRVEHRAPRGHLHDHRPEDDGPARRPARRGRRHARHRHARPHRRDRPARPHAARTRRRLRITQPRPGRPPAQLTRQARRHQWNTDDSDVPRCA